MMVHWPTFILSGVCLILALLLLWSERRHKRAGSQIIQRLNEHHESSQQMLTELREASQQTLQMNQEIQEMLRTMHTGKDLNISTFLKTEKFHVS